MPAPQAPPSGWRTTHPPLAVLELAELVLDGALARLPRGLFAEDDIPGGLILEDAEGTPVAAVSAEGSVGALRPFAHPPLRSHRLTAVQVRERLARRVSSAPSGSDSPILAVVVDRPLTDEVVADLRTRTRAAHLVWLALVGAGRARPGPDSLTPEALLRAVRVVAGDLEAEPVVVPVALPAGHDALLGEIARSYGCSDLLRPAAWDGADSSPHRAFAEELARSAVPAHRQGLVVFFTGLSGSGKSTLAKALADRVLERGLRTVSLLDGDEVRRLLSAGLGFSAEDRAANIARIGFVAAEVARHGGMAIAAPIAPFAQGRAQVRRMVTEAGGTMVLVHVATPLAECERRDRKGLYARARRGEIQEFTGISSPYEEPTDADLTIDTTGRHLADCVDVVWRLLQDGGRLVGDEDDPTGHRTAAR